MPDIQWDLLDSPFIVELTAQADDIDELHHVNNAVYVKWCEQAGWMHAAKLGLTIAEYQRLDRAMALRRSEYNYLLPARMGDKLLLATWLTATDGKLAVVRNFQLIRYSDHATLMRAHWDLICIELSTGKPRRMPVEFRNGYAAAAGIRAEQAN